MREEGKRRREGADDTDDVSISTEIFRKRTAAWKRRQEVPSVALSDRPIAPVRRGHVKYFSNKNNILPKE